MLNWLSRLLPERKAALNTVDLLKLLNGQGRVSKTGATITTATALEVSAVYACVRVIGEGIAQVPLKLIQVSADGKNRLPARKHPLYDVLSVQPNPWQTSFEFRETLAWHVVLGGNFYAFKNLLGGKVRELIPFQPGTMQVKREDDGTLRYIATTQEGKTQEFPAALIWHVRGPSWNVWMGLDVIGLAREAIGLARASEEAHSFLFKNGVSPKGTYSVEGTLTKEQHATLRGFMDKEMAGTENSGKLMLLDRSAKFLNTALTGVDAQHLETRKHQIGEVCRYFRVNPIMLYGDDKQATFAGSEQNFLSHVVHTLAPWYQRLEQSIDVNLLTKQERADGFYSQFVEEGLLRGDSKATAEFLDKLTKGLIMTPNEARAKLDMNPIDGLDERYRDWQLSQGIGKPNGDQNPGV